MDLSTTIIGLLLMALFLLPVILISRAGRSKRVNFEKVFFSEVSRNKLNISEKDFFNEFAIGIDTSRNKIIYLDWRGWDMVNLIFDLKDVKVFESVPSYGEQKKKNFNYKNVDRLGLRFHFKEFAKPDVNITFYIAGFGRITDDEVKLFTKWLGIIRKKLDTKSLGDFRHSA